MKKTIASVVTAAVVAVPFVSPAQLATIDVASISQLILQVQAWGSQYSQMMCQISQYSNMLTNAGCVANFKNIGSLIGNSLVNDISSLDVASGFNVNLGSILNSGVTSSLGLQSQFMHLQNQLSCAISMFNGSQISTNSDFSSVALRLAAIQSAQSNADNMESNAAVLESSLASLEATLVCDITNASDVATQQGFMAQLQQAQQDEEKLNHKVEQAHNAVVDAALANQALTQAAQLASMNLDSVEASIASQQISSQISADNAVYSSEYVASANPIFNFSYVGPQ